MCHMSGARCEVSGVRCQVSGVRCQVSGVRCQVKDVRFYLFFEKVVELVSGGPVIHRAYPAHLVSLKIKVTHKTCSLSVV